MLPLINALPAIKRCQAQKLRGAFQSDHKYLRGCFMSVKLDSMLALRPPADFWQEAELHLMLI